MTRANIRSIGFGVALSSASLITTELILTRIFSVVVWYHFAFFAISVALFGTGAAALFVHLGQRQLERHGTGELLGLGAVALAIAIALVDLVLLDVAPRWFGVGSAAFEQLTLKLLFLFLLAAAPFLCGGFTLALAMSRFALDIHRLYFWDLVGAGAGCALVVPLLSVLGGPTALLAASVLACGAALSFSRLSSGRRLRHAALGVFLGIALLGAAAPSLGLLQVRVAKGIRTGSGQAELNLWNSFSMVTVLPERHFTGWGTSATYTGPVPDQKKLVIDMNAMTALTRFNGDFSSVPHISYDLSAFVYRLAPRAGEVCVIGAGGGKDVLAALQSGARHVTAVEINPLIVDDVMLGAYRDYTGALYARDDVDVHVEDGRSFVRSSKRRYDILQLSMVDTSAATAAGAYVLTENSLYTADAFEDFLASLEPTGILTVSSVSLPDLAVGARLVAIGREALQRRGADPGDSMVVLQGGWLGTGVAIYDVLIKPSGFTKAESDRVAQLAQQLQFLPVYVPSHGTRILRPEHRWIEAIVRAESDAQLEAKMSTWPLDVSATTDDRPFFFYQNRLSDLGQALFAPGPGHLFGNGLVFLAKIAIVALVLVMAFLLVPFARAAAALAEGRGHPGWDLAYVASLGLGFMFVEIALVQRFSVYLGHPTATLSVVLFVLLVMGGIGSRWLARDGVARARRVRWVLVALIGYAALLTAASPWLLDVTRTWSGGGRSVLAGLAMAPLGLLIGVPFPGGLGSVASRARRRIPWLWSINSATSVLGAILSTLVALHAGISTSLWVGIALYVVALLLSLRVLETGAASRA